MITKDLEKKVIQEHFSEEEKELYVCPVTGLLMREPVFIGGMYAVLCDLQALKIPVISGSLVGVKVEGLQVFKLLQSKIQTKVQEILKTSEKVVRFESIEAEDLLRNTMPTFDELLQKNPQRFAITNLLYCTIMDNLNTLNPVLAADGRLYDKGALEFWINALEAAGTVVVDPIENKPLSKEFVEDYGAAQIAQALKFPPIPQDTIDEYVSDKLLSRGIITEWMEKILVNRLSAEEKHEYLCPITELFMREPVVAHDGIVYELAAIKAWIAENREGEWCKLPFTPGMNSYEEKSGFDKVDWQERVVVSLQFAIKNFIKDCIKKSGSCAEVVFTRLNESYTDEQVFQAGKQRRKLLNQSMQHLHEATPKRKWPKCPMTDMLPLDPVVVDDGYVYEKRVLLKWIEIRKWLKQDIISPTTFKPLGGDGILCEDFGLKKYVKDVNHLGDQVGDAHVEKFALTAVLSYFRSLGDSSISICPITNNIPLEPVLASDGRIYERKAIERWFETCKMADKPVTVPNCEPVQTFVDETLYSLLGLKAWEEFNADTTKSPSNIDEKLQILWKRHDRMGWGAESTSLDAGVLSRMKLSQEGEDGKVTLRPNAALILHNAIINNPSGNLVKFHLTPEEKKKRRSAWIHQSSVAKVMEEKLSTVTFIIEGVEFLKRYAFPDFIKQLLASTVLPNVMLRMKIAFTAPAISEGTQAVASFVEKNITRNMEANYVLDSVARHMAIYGVMEVLSQGILGGEKAEATYYRSYARQLIQEQLLDATVNYPLRDAMLTQEKEIRGCIFKLRQELSKCMTLENGDSEQHAFMVKSSTAIFITMMAKNLLIRNCDNQCRGFKERWHIFLKSSIFAIKAVQKVKDGEYRVEL